MVRGSDAFKRNANIPQSPSPLIFLITLLFLHLASGIVLPFPLNEKTLFYFIFFLKKGNQPVILSALFVMIILLLLLRGRARCLAPAVCILSVQTAPYRVGVHSIEAAFPPLPPCACVCALKQYRFDQPREFRYRIDRDTSGTGSDPDGVHGAPGCAS